MNVCMVLLIFTSFLLHIPLILLLFISTGKKRDVQLKKLAFDDATFVCSLTQNTKVKSTVSSENKVQ